MTFVESITMTAGWRGSTGLFFSTPESLICK